VLETIPVPRAALYSNETLLALLRACRKPVRAMHVTTILHALHPGPCTILLPRALVQELLTLDETCAVPSCSSKQAYVERNFTKLPRVLVCVLRHAVGPTVMLTLYRAVV
jgi:hypothetical protein